MAYRKTPAVHHRLASTRERLVRQATSVVAEAGWANASVTAVAAAAGISVGSVYQHFPSKGALAVEVFRRAAGREVEVLCGVLRDGGGDPVERLARGVEAFARRALESRGLAHALLAAPAEPALGQERLSFRRRYREAFVEVIREGIGAGLLPAQDAEVTAAALTGAIGEVLVEPLSDPVEGAVADQLIGELVAMSLRCAGATPPSHSYDPKDSA
ncbi:TetR/AcrR family transcriptional regulator [Streptomyces sp. NPDC052052]|uniref:TetR/AcrR family transcriptional regulator n=1 Tax=Streptomyces sp. NPDC052052 TaxID=3154756 RepID=UPI00343E5313